MGQVNLKDLHKLPLKELEKVADYYGVFAMNLTKDRYHTIQQIQTNAYNKYLQQKDYIKGKILSKDQFIKNHWIHY